MFKNIFGSNKEKSEKKEVINPTINWVPLTSVDEINKIKEESKKNYIGVFKHSTRCSISRSVLKRFEADFPQDLNVTMYYIDLLNYREVSGEIGLAFEVIHQSPQFLLIRDEKAIADASHYDILEINFNNLVK